MEQERITTNDHDISPITFLKKQLEASLARNQSLEKENHELKQELSRLRAQVNALKAHDNDRKSMLWKKLHYSMDGRATDKHQQKPLVTVQGPDTSAPMVNSNSRAASIKERTVEESTTRISPISVKDSHEKKPPSAPGHPPPPPPPIPSKLLDRSKAVRRVPELMEFYRTLMKRDAQSETKSNQIGNTPAPNSRNMIGEIENRSTYLLAIKTDVETQREFINFLIREVETVGFKEISDVEPFVKWLDEELSCLVDERAVLKHFPKWPERKADALREAAFSYRDLKSLQSEVSSFKDNPKQLSTQSLRKIQALQDRLELSVNNIERLREGTSKRYRDFHIPWEWMLETGVIGQMKLSSLKLSKEYMKRITKEMQFVDCLQDEGLLLQGVRFALRIHQFAGGFDVDTMRAFEELKKVYAHCPKQ